MLLVFLISVDSVCAGEPKFEEPVGAIPFRHHAPLSVERHMHSFMGSGLGWIDLDRDGIWDLLCCQGAPVEPQPTANDIPNLHLSRGQEGLKFADRSRSAGLSGRAYAFGLTIADFDNDGFSDVFVTGLMTAVLYRNQGDGTLLDVTRAAGIEPSGFGSGCCWTDVDQDGNLDLFYVKYIALDLKKYPLCTSAVGKERIPIACSPIGMKGEADTLYLSRGDGSFSDISKQAGLLSAPRRKGLGVVAVDLDDDGRTEIYVANDGNPNDLHVRDASGKWREIGLLAGVAVNRAGFDEAGMGISIGDVDGDLRPEIFVTNFFNETNTLYRNEGTLSFLDVTESFNLSAPSLQKVAFGTTLADFDNDGWPDLLIANGHVVDNIPQVRPKNPEPYAQRSQLLQNRRGRRFEEVSLKAGDYFNRSHVGRGTAAADIDSDGRIDAAILRLNDSVALLNNRTPPSGHWMELDLQGTDCNRDAIGATVIVRAGKDAWRRDRMSSASYLSCDSSTLHIGLGEHAQIDDITVRWPGGESESFETPAVDLRMRLTQGAGRSKP